MSKRRRGRDHSSRSLASAAPRDSFDSLLGFRPPVRSVALDPVSWDLADGLLSDLREIEDRRHFYPPVQARDQALAWQPAKRLSGALARLDVPTYHPPSRSLNLRPARGLPGAIGFEDPSRVVICVRRQRRKEVLHAKRVAGARGLASPRRNEYSTITCKGKR